MVQNLLDTGADVQAENSFDIRPLHRAAQANWISATKVLLKAGANLIEYAFDAGAPIHWAAAAGSVDVLEVHFNTLLLSSYVHFVVTD